MFCITMHLCINEVKYSFLIECFKNNFRNRDYALQSAFMFYIINPDNFI